MPKAEWTPSAKHDLSDIGHYIGFKQRRPTTAENVVRQLNDKCNEYAESPLIGTKAPQLGEDCRIFSHKRWVVVYRPLPDGIQVIRILDGARDYPRLFWSLNGGPWQAANS